MREHSSFPVIYLIISSENRGVNAENAGKLIAHGGDIMKFEAFTLRAGLWTVGICEGQHIAGKLTALEIMPVLGTEAGKTAAQPLALLRLIVKDGNQHDSIPLQNDWKLINMITVLAFLRQYGFLQGMNLRT